MSNQKMHKAINSEPDIVLARKYASDFSIPLELAQIIANRFSEYSEAKNFLFPELSLLHNPANIPDIESAATMIVQSLKKKEGVLVYCHDDTDGYTSGVLMYKTLKDLARNSNQQIVLYPIRRERDGYILNPEVLQNYRQKGIKLVITVDFGISSQENFRIAKEEGMKLVVCDHHEINASEFPSPAVDPKRPDSQYPFRELAGVGVSFKLAQCLYQHAFGLTPEEFYSLKKDFFVLVLIGTISDRVVLQGENRVFCIHGLKMCNEMNIPWLKCFQNRDEFDVPVVTGNIIPTIASASHVDPNYAVEIMTGHDIQRIKNTIDTLKKVTVERRRGVSSLFKAALSAAKIYENVVVSVIPCLKQLYLGSVSARLRDHCNRTSAVIGIKNGKCHGELRSKNISVYEMLFFHRKFFLDFGGHHRAGGFTMMQEKLDRFLNEMVKYTMKHNKLVGTDSGTSSDPRESAVLLDRSNINILKPLAPFGEGNPPPVLTDGTFFYTIDNKFRILEKG